MYVCDYSYSYVCAFHLFLYLPLSLILLLSLFFFHLLVSSTSNLISVTLFHCLFITSFFLSLPPSLYLPLFHSSTLPLPVPSPPPLSPSITISSFPSLCFSPPGTLLSEAVVTHLGTSLAQHSCAQAQPYLQSPTLQKEESRDKGGVPDMIYPTPLVSRYVKFSGKVRFFLCACVCVWYDYYCTKSNEERKDG